MVKAKREGQASAARDVEKLKEQKRGQEVKRVKFIFNLCQ